MTDLLLDTHIALWLDSGDEKLGTTSRRTIESAWNGGGRLFFSAVSAWEIAVLVDKELIELDLPVAAWVDRFVGRPGLEALPLDHRAATLAYNLGNLDHRDPADRLLIASAIGLDCPLVTHDDRIRRFAKGHGKQLGFAVA
ncbi:type II toxin-antitoxin system VapC family toxin [Reyranella sp.]|uniref:type II toxin-antitoxin system VapC family toxin n=1 Tax=Reyranella sp. TaxID=1929291 RepID=UPI003D09AE43